MDRKEDEIRSQLFYFLDNFNLDFVSLSGEEVTFYDPEKSFTGKKVYGDGSNESISCSDLRNVSFNDLRECYSQSEALTSQKAKEVFLADEETITDVNHMAVSYTHLTLPTTPYV